MSPASYRAAPPRVGDPTVHAVRGRVPRGPLRPRHGPATAPSHRSQHRARLPGAAPRAAYSPVRGRGPHGRGPRNAPVRRPAPARGDPPPRDLVLRRTARLAPRERRPGFGAGAVHRRRPAALHMEGPGGAAAARPCAPAAAGAVPRPAPPAGRPGPRRRDPAAPAFGRAEPPGPSRSCSDAPAPDAAARRAGAVRFGERAGCLARAAGELRAHPAHGLAPEAPRAGQHAASRRLTPPPGPGRTGTGARQPTVRPLRRRRPPATATPTPTAAATGHSRTPSAARPARPPQ